MGHERDDINDLNLLLDGQLPVPAESGWQWSAGRNVIRVTSSVANSRHRKPCSRRNPGLVFAGLEGVLRVRCDLQRNSRQTGAVFAAGYVVALTESQIKTYD